MNKIKLPHITVLKNHHLSPEAFQSLWTYHKGKCAWCNKKMYKASFQHTMDTWDRYRKKGKHQRLKQLIIEHDHNHCDMCKRRSCGHSIRGITHQSCNSRIAKIEHKLHLHTQTEIDKDRFIEYVLKGFFNQNKGEYIVSKYQEECVRLFKGGPNGLSPSPPTILKNEGTNG